MERPLTAGKDRHFFIDYMIMQKLLTNEEFATLRTDMVKCNKVLNVCSFFK